MLSGYTGHHFRGSYLGPYGKCAQFKKTVLLPGGRHSIYKRAPVSSTAQLQGTADASLDASTPTCVFVYFESMFHHFHDSTRHLRDATEA